MDKDLKWIKKHYGEEMMHLCRSTFSNLLEIEGLLPSFLEEHFCQHRSLAKDIISQNKVEEFKAFVFSNVDVEKVNNNDKEKQNLTAKELFEKAGYILYPECETEEDIQSFRHYYKRRDGKTPVYEGGSPAYYDGEELCTFNGGRLNSCRVWFAVKKDVDDIKREDFDVPTRQDKYGTSVLSIQFTRGGRPTLSIKNRYNHTVNNPDNTFNSNLDNIAEGLTDAFERDYGVRDYYIDGRKSDFELDGYVKANDGKFYPYNHEINNIYYCPNNIIIDNFEVKKLPSHQILAGYFIIDCKEGTISLYDEDLNDEFANIYAKNKGISVKDGVITIEKQDGSNAILKINNKRQLVSFEDNGLKECGDYFLYYNHALEDINVPNLEEVGDDFLLWNMSIKKLSLPNLKKCGSGFIQSNKILEYIEVPNLEKCASRFLCYNTALKKLSLPKLRECGDIFLSFNCGLEDIEAPELDNCGLGFLHSNNALKKLSLPKLTGCGENFLAKNKVLEEVYIPNLCARGAYMFREHDKFDSLQQYKRPIKKFSKLKKFFDIFKNKNNKLEQ